MSVWRGTCYIGGLFFGKMDVICGPERFGSYMGTEEWLTLNELRDKNLLCDALLRLNDGGVFPVHRIVLLKHSNFFRFVWLLM
jgi:hypothetical protein